MRWEGRSIFFLTFSVPTAPTLLSEMGSSRGLSSQSRTHHLPQVPTNDAQDHFSIKSKVFPKGFPRILICNSTQTCSDNNPVMLS